MSSDKEPKQDDPAQSQRFIDMAKEVGAGNNTKIVEETFKELATSESPSNSKKRDGKRS